MPGSPQKLWSIQTTRLPLSTDQFSSLSQPAFPFYLYRNPSVLDEEETLKISSYTRCHFRDKTLVRLMTYRQFASLQACLFLASVQWGFGMPEGSGNNLRFLSPVLGDLLLSSLRHLPEEWKSFRFLSEGHAQSFQSICVILSLGHLCLWWHVGLCINLLVLP